MFSQLLNSSLARSIPSPHKDNVIGQVFLKVPIFWSWGRGEWPGGFPCLLGPAFLLMAPVVPLPPLTSIPKGGPVLASMILAEVMASQMKEGCNVCVSPLSSVMRREGIWSVLFHLWAEQIIPDSWSQTDKFSTSWNCLWILSMDSPHAGSRTRWFLGSS